MLGFASQSFRFGGVCVGQNVLVENLSQVNLETLSWSEKKKNVLLAFQKA